MLVIRLSVAPATVSTSYVADENVKLLGRPRPTVKKSCLAGSLFTQTKQESPRGRVIVDRLSMVEPTALVANVSAPVPLLRTRINQPSERVDTAGRVHVPAPPVHTKQEPREDASIVGTETYSLVMNADSSLPKRATVLVQASDAASAVDVPVPNAMTAHTPACVVLLVM